MCKHIAINTVSTLEFCLRFPFEFDVYPITHGCAYVCVCVYVLAQIPSIVGGICAFLFHLMSKYHHSMFFEVLFACVCAPYSNICRTLAHMGWCVRPAQYMWLFRHVQINISKPINPKPCYCRVIPVMRKR